MGIAIMLFLCFANGLFFYNDPSNWWNAFASGFCLMGALYLIRR